MDDIDRAGESLIEGCVAGVARTFRTVDEHRTLARWIALVAMLYDQTNETPAISSDVHEDFYDTREPPKDMLAWIAATELTPGRYELNGWPRPVNMRSASYSGTGYFCTFRIQHFVAQCFLWAS